MVKLFMNVVRDLVSFILYVDKSFKYWVAFVVSWDRVKISRVMLFKSVYC